MSISFVLETIYEEYSFTVSSQTNYVYRSKILTVYLAMRQDFDTPFKSANYLFVGINFIADIHNFSPFIYL